MENHTMSKAKFIVIAMLSLFMTVVALAQPAQKKTRPTAKGIWGMETPFGNVVSTQRTRRPQLRANNANTQPVESLSLNFDKLQNHSPRSKR